MISIFDTSICDNNLGNQIIMDAINEIMDELFPDDFKIKLQYLEKFGSTSSRYIRNSEFAFFGGTNALSSKMNSYKQMGFTFSDIFKFSNVVLLGVGWWKYQFKPNLYTRTLLKNILSSKMIHSVRDEYTKKHLESIGIKNVLNTSCPTTWKLDNSKLARIPNKKSDNVICTLTEYNPDPIQDALLINILLKNYKKVYFWIQGSDDVKYLQTLSIPMSKLNFIPPNLDKYNKFLINNDVDYVGTRLHAGIRAIQFQKRTLIVAIDNRSIEIANQIGLNLIDRSEINNLTSFLGKDLKLKLNLPMGEIIKWKSQFSKI